MYAARSVVYQHNQDNQNQISCRKIWHRPITLFDLIWTSSQQSTDDNRKALTDYKPSPRLENISQFRRNYLHDWDYKYTAHIGDHVTLKHIKSSQL